MPHTKYQEIITLCKCGKFKLARKLIIAWTHEDKAFNVRHAINIFNIYRQRIGD